MHANTVIEAEEIGHGRVDKDFARARPVDSGVCIFVDDFPCGTVLDDAVKGRFVIRALLGDLKSTRRGDVFAVS